MGESEVQDLQGRPLAGTALKRITAMEYYAYNAHIPVRTSNPKHWTSWKGWWTYPRQLIQLQLTACSPGGKQRKQFWFAPWQKFKEYVDVAVDAAITSVALRETAKWYDNTEDDQDNARSPTPALTLSTGPETTTTGGSRAITDAVLSSAFGGR